MQIQSNVPKNIDDHINGKLVKYLVALTTEN